MNTNRCYPQFYKCPQCSLIQEHYVWANDLETTEHECNECKTKITVSDKYKKERVEVPIIKTPTKHRY